MKILLMLFPPTQRMNLISLQDHMIVQFEFGMQAVQNNLES